MWRYCRLNLPFFPISAIIKGFGFDTLKTQLITAPVYFFAAGVYLLVAYFSDRMGKRSVFMVPLACIIIAGYAILLSPIDSLAPRLVAVILAASGIYSCVGLNVSLHVLTTHIVSCGRLGCWLTPCRLLAVLLQRLDHTPGIFSRYVICSDTTP